MPPFFIGIERRFAVVEKRVQSCKNRCFLYFMLQKRGDWNLIFREKR